MITLNDLETLNNSLDNRYAIASKLTVRTPKMNKKSRKTGEPVPERIQGIREIHRELVRLDYDYSHINDGKLRKNGIKKDYDAGETFYIRDGIIGTHKKNPNAKYLVYNENIKGFDNVDIFVAVDGDGNVIPKDEYKEIKEEYFASGELKKYESKRQVEQGIDESKITIQKINKLENVVMLKGSTIDKKSGENYKFEISDPETLKDIQKYL